MQEKSYQQISAEQAKTILEEETSAILLDVRERSEYEERHIPGAALLPLDTIDAESAADVIPDSDTIVLVYCRSGNRSQKASAKLVELGYTQVYEFGGILDWPYETE